MSETIKSADKNLENFEFGEAAHKIYDFFWHDFCDTYIEESKSQIAKLEQSENSRRLQSKIGGIISKSQTKEILMFVLSNSLKLLHPFIPFITEEIYKNLPIKNKKEFLMIEDWPR